MQNSTELPNPTEPATKPKRSRGRIALLSAIVIGPLIVVAKGALHPEGDLYDKVVARTTASVCVITVDGLAPYDLPLYNPNLPENEFLTEFARLGVTVHHAYGATSTSPAAPVSVLTGELPSTHGVLNFQNQLNPAISTLAEMFDRRGMRTAAFSNLPLLSQCGLDRGFQTRNEVVGAGPEVIAREASRWLADLGEEYFFVWVHLYLRPQDRDDRAGAFASLLSELVDGMKKGRKYEGTFFIATGTYGRLGGDLSVPTLWKIPARTAMGAKRNGPCSTLDIVPTLAAIFGLRGSIGWPGRDLVAKPDMPLYSGHYFTEPAGVLFELTTARNRQTILGIRNHNWAVTQGPAPADVAAYRVGEDPGMSNNQVGTPDGDRAKSYLIGEMYKRKNRVPHQQPPAGRRVIPEELRGTLESIGVMVTPGP